MTRGQPDPLVVRRHLAALRASLAHLRRHAGRTARELRASADLRWAVDRLAELGVLPAEFAARLRPIAGFRNVLVHGYLQVDLGVVEGVLRHRLDDLEEFAGRVEAHLVGI